MSYGPVDGKAARVLTPFDFLAHHFYRGDYGQAALWITEQDVYRQPLDQSQQQYQSDGVDMETGTDADGYRIDACFVDEVKERSIEWLWPSFLPTGMFTLYSGEQGTSKSILAASLTAIVTKGSRWPDQSPNTVGPASVLFLDGENDVDTVMRPRLEAAGADLRLVQVMGPYLKTSDMACRGLSLTDHRLMIADRVALFAKRELPPCRLIIIDPIGCLRADHQAKVAIGHGESGKAGTTQIRTIGRNRRQEATIATYSQFVSKLSGGSDELGT